MNIRELRQACDEHDHWPLFERLLNMELREHKTVKSPLREEKNPSFGVYRGQDGKVRFKDFGDQYGDIYHLVMLLCNTTYPKAVETVAAMLDIRPSDIPKPIFIRSSRVPKVENPSKCSFTKRAWRDHDIVFWEQFGIPLHLLEEYDVHACQRFYMTTADGREIRWAEGVNRPLYVYRIDDRLKLYDPNSPNKKHRYIGNTGREQIFGLERLRRSGKHPVAICAGQKDALTLMANFSQWKAVSFNAESLVPDVPTMLELNKLSERLVVIYDNDKTGITYSKRLKDEYPFITRIPMEELCPPGCKDLSDIVAGGWNRTLDTLEDWLFPG